MPWVRGAVCLAAVGLSLVLAGRVEADASFVLPPACGTPVEVLSQRALIAFRDGHETLVVQPTFSSEAKELVWLMPIPSVPDKVEVVSPGALKTLSFEMQPRVIGRAPFELVLIVTTLAASVVLALLTGIVRTRSLPSDVTGFVTDFLVIGVLTGVIVWLLLLVGYASRKDTGWVCRTTAMLDDRQARIRGYEVAVLRPDSVAELNQCLTGRGAMPLPRQGEEAAASYISDGWCFVAARLVRTNSGRGVPDPLRIDFKTPKAVFPMRWSAPAGASSSVELFVVGDGAASGAGLRRELCDTFAKSTAATLRHSVGGGLFRHIDRNAPLFTGKQVGIEVGHSDLVGVLWDLCVVTKLVGALSATEMKEDVTFSWSDPIPLRNSVFTGVCADTVSQLAALLCFLVFLVVGFYLFSVHRTWIRNNNWRSFLICLGLAAVVSVLAGAIVRALLPTADTWPNRRYNYELTRFAEGHGNGALSYSTPVEKVIHEVEEGARARVYLNAFTGEPVIRESSPGNYDVRKTDSALQIIVYDRTGVETVYDVAAAPARPEAKKPLLPTPPPSSSTSR